jgi:hypothetical protein
MRAGPFELNAPPVAYRPALAAGKQEHRELGGSSQTHRSENHDAEVYSAKIRGLKLQRIDVRQHSVSENQRFRKPAFQKQRLGKHIVPKLAMHDTGAHFADRARNVKQHSGQEIFSHRAPLENS